MGRGPVCHESNPCHERTVGSTGINDEADPSSPVLLPKGRRPSGSGASQDEVTDVQRTLNKLSLANRESLTQIAVRLRSPKDLSAKELRDFRRAQTVLAANHALIAAARKVAEGQPRALSEIISALSNRSGHPHNRYVAVILLSLIGSAKSLQALAARVTDPSDADYIRFFCAIMLEPSGRPLALSLILKAINDPSTWEEFDDEAGGREKLVESGLPTNLRFFLIEIVENTTEGKAELESRLRTPLTFQEGWLATILWFWLGTQNNDWLEDSGSEYIRIAADVLRLRAAPVKLRYSAAYALHFMRKHIKDRSQFPRAAWDALHSTYRENLPGSLRDLIEKTLKMQGNAPRR